MHGGNVGGEGTPTNIHQVSNALSLKGARFRQRSSLCNVRCSDEQFILNNIATTDSESQLMVIVLRAEMSNKVSVYDHPATGIAGGKKRQKIALPESRMLL